MALVLCPECQKSISDQATACPHCGCPLKRAAPIEDKGKAKCPHCGKRVDPVVTNVGGGSCSVGSREKWTCPSCKHVIMRKGCFVATAVFGDEDTVEVKFLRAFRDEYLLPNATGRILTQSYYLIGPYIAAVANRIPFLSFIARKLLERIVKQIEHRTPLKREAYREEPREPRI